MSVNVIVDYAECAEIVVDYANMMSAESLTEQTKCQLSP